MPEDELYNISQLIIKKISHSCCNEKTMNGFRVNYFDGDKWQTYQEGAVIKTGQLPSDDVEKERIIYFDPPFNASKVKLINSRD